MNRRDTGQTILFGSPRALETLRTHLMCVARGGDRALSVAEHSTRTRMLRRRCSQSLKQKEPGY